MSMFRQIQGKLKEPTFGHVDGEAVSRGGDSPVARRVLRRKLLLLLLLLLLHVL